MDLNQIAQEAYDNGYSAALRITKQTQLVEEAALHAARTVIDKLDEWDGRRIGNWAAVIARNKAIDLKHAAYKTELTEPYEFFMDEAAAPLPPEEADYTSLHKAIESLSPRKRELLTLHYYGGMEMQTIAESLGTSLSNVKVTVMRARQDIKEYLDKTSNS